MERESRECGTVETKTGRGGQQSAVLTVLESGMRGGQDDDCRFRHMKTFGYIPDGVGGRRA